MRAGFAKVLPDRAVLPLLRPRRQALSGTDFPQALAPARGAHAVVPLDDDRVAGAAVTGGRAAAPPARRALEGKSLAQNQGTIRAPRGGPADAPLRLSITIRRGCGPSRGNPILWRVRHRFPRGLLRVAATVFCAGRPTTPARCPRPPPASPPGASPSSCRVLMEASTDGQGVGKLPISHSHVPGGPPAGAPREAQEVVRRSPLQEVQPPPTACGRALSSSGVSSPATR
jgi:hypothetical protein